MKYAEVIGDPISHSKSPTIHGFWLKVLGLDGEYRATHVTPGGWPTISPRASPIPTGSAATSPSRIRKPRSPLSRIVAG